MRTDAVNAMDDHPSKAAVGKRPCRPAHHAEFEQTLGQFVHVPPRAFLQVTDAAHDPPRTPSFIAAWLPEHVVLGAGTRGDARRFWGPRAAGVSFKTAGLWAVVAFTGEQVFFLFAWLVNFAVAIALLRQFRRPVNLALGLLFLLNGLITESTFLGASSDHLSSVAEQFRRVLDPLTSVAILGAALVFPRPAWGLRPRTIGLVLASTSALFLLAAWQDFYGLTHPRSYTATLSLPQFVFGYLIQQLAWIAVLLRWGHAAWTETSPLARRQTQILLAAFGLRAVHITLVVLGEDLAYVRTATSVWAQMAIAIEVLTLVAAGWVVWRLVQARPLLDNRDRLYVQFIILTLLFGVLEAFLTRGFAPFGRIDFQYATFILAHLDVWVLRPVLVYYAFLRYDLGGMRRYSAHIGTAMAALLAGTVVLAGMTSRPEVIPVALGYLMASAAGLLVGALVWPVAKHARNRQAVEAFVAAADPERRGSARELATLRDELGLDGRQAQELLEAVRSNWGSAAGREWYLDQAILGRYRIRAFLGAGTAGEVYRAHDIVDNERVVLKRTRRLDPDAQRLLLHEAAILRELDHPNIVRLLRVESLENERILVLEHADDGSLATRMTKGRMEPAEVQRIARGMLAGLAAAHRSGVHHGDLTPSNVLLSGNRVLLCDFEASRGAGLVAVDRATPHYQAPERRHGAGPSVQGDLYAWGRIVLDMAHGRRLATVPEPLRLPPGYGQGWKAMVEAALRPDARTRPESVTALLSLGRAKPRGKAGSSAQAE